MEDNKQNTTNTTNTTNTAGSSDTVAQTGAATPSPDPTATPAANVTSNTPNNSSGNETSSPTLLKPDGNAGTAVDSTTLKSGIDQALAGISTVPASATVGGEDIFTQLAENIIKEQESIIGPVALEQATKVEGLSVDLATNKITFQGDKKQILERLVRQYEQLFGRISIEICKEAVRNIIPQAPKDQVPQILL